MRPSFHNQQGCVVLFCVFMLGFFFICNIQLHLLIFFIEIIRLKTDKVWNHFFGLVLDVFLGVTFSLGCNCNFVS